MLSNSPKLDKLPNILDVRTRPGFLCANDGENTFIFHKKKIILSCNRLLFFSDLFLVLKIFYHGARFYF